jgi:hypothetical protein
VVKIRDAVFLGKDLFKKHVSPYLCRPKNGGYIIIITVLKEWIGSSVGYLA